MYSSAFESYHIDVVSSFQDMKTIDFFFILFCVANINRIEAELSDNSSTHIAKCDREISRRVRRYLQNDVFSQLMVKASDLPTTCPLNEALDMYSDQEDHKRESNRNEWRVRSSC
jgi:hypothetical protein